MNEQNVVRHFFLAVSICFLVSTAQAEDGFSKGNQEYGAGHYKEAVDAYEQSAHEGSRSANLLYDLGNAYFHSGDLGRAILNYERALVLDRHHPEAETNLLIARDEAHALTLTARPAETLADIASSNQYAVTVAVTFWIGVFCFAGWILSRRRSAKLLGISILTCVVFFASMAGVVLRENGNRGRGFAVVTAKNATARLATAENSRSVLELPAGSELKIVSKRGDWLFAELPNDLRGWIPASSAEQVRL